MPGLTRAAVPILAGAGVRALSVGVNDAAAPPTVPKNRPFWWRDQPSGAQLLAFWHPGTCVLGWPWGVAVLADGSGPLAAERCPSCSPDSSSFRYLTPSLQGTAGPCTGAYSGVPVDSREECVQVAGFDRGLCLSWGKVRHSPTHSPSLIAPAAAASSALEDGAEGLREPAEPAVQDNVGPPTVDQVLDVFERVRAAFPDAEVVASGFDDFVGPLLEAAPTLDLPVVSSLPFFCASFPCSPAPCVMACGALH